MVESTLNFSDIGIKDIARVGGKNTALGEMWTQLSPLGVNVLVHFATTAQACRRFMQVGGLDAFVAEQVAGLNMEDIPKLESCGKTIRRAILAQPLTDELNGAIRLAYGDFCARLGYEPAMAVRSSATAEDLPQASFAGAAETYLNVRGEAALLKAIHRCYASIFSDRALSYRARLGFDSSKIALSVGVQPMVRSDLACSGVMFTLETESGFRDV